MGEIGATHTMFLPRIGSMYSALLDEDVLKISRWVDKKMSDSEIHELGRRYGVELKQGEIIINGYAKGINQKQGKYTAYINNYLVEGNNAIKIIPSNKLDIIKMEVYSVKV